MLVRAPRCPRPLQQVNCTLVFQNEAHECPTEDAVRAATHDVDVVRRRRVLSARLHHLSVLEIFAPLVAKPIPQYARPIYTFDVIGTVVQPQDLCTTTEDLLSH